MSLEKITRKFAQQREIKLRNYKSGVMGYQYPFRAAYSLRGKREKIMIRKKLPPFNIIESSISAVTTPGGDESVFTVAIINGCLKDYLALLQGAQDNLSRALCRTLSAYLGSEEDPMTYIRKTYMGVNHSDLGALLPLFYPIN